MSARIDWVIDPPSAWMSNYRQWAKDITEVVEDVIGARAQEVEDWMKASHPWKNRTGLAERSLDTALVRDGLKVTLVMYHGANVPYSRFLERYMQSGRFSVLIPALEYWGPILLADVQKALR